MRSDVDFDEDGPGRLGLRVALQDVDVLVVVEQEGDLDGLGELEELGERAGVDGDAVETLCELVKWVGWWLVG